MFVRFDIIQVFIFFLQILKFVFVSICLNQHFIERYFAVITSIVFSCLQSHLSLSSCLPLFFMFSHLPSFLSLFFSLLPASSPTLTASLFFLSFSWFPFFFSSLFPSFVLSFPFPSFLVSFPFPSFIILVLKIFSSKLMVNFTILYLKMMVRDMELSKAESVKGGVFTWQMCRNSN